MNPFSANHPTTTRNWRSLGLSFFFHLLLVVFLLLFGFSAQRRGTEGELRRTGIVLASQNQLNQTEYLDEKDLAEEQESEAESSQTVEAASSPPPALNVEFEQPDRPDLPGFSDFDSQTDVNQMVDNASNNASFEQTLNEADLKAIAADQRYLASKAPKGNPTTISVFGTGGLNGRSFVFVLDRSKSMGSQGLGVIQAARSELSAAISELDKTHSFQIVAYHEQTVTMNERRMLPGTAGNKKDVPNFIGGLAAYGPTNHLNGLTAAAAFQPDIVVFMTDGGYPELNESELKLVKRMMPRTCQVHCIQFGMGSQQVKSNFMSRLASSTGGSYRYINVKQWKQENE